MIPRICTFLALLFAITGVVFAGDDRPIVDASKLPIEKIARSSLPTLHIVGDSTVRGTGSGKGIVGWGDCIKPFFDTNKINVVNNAIGGRSARTYFSEGRWQKVADAIKPGDFVIIQFGHNDGGKIGDPANKHRADGPGIGDETATDTMPDGTVERVHTFGWYMSRFVTDAKARGATVVLCSPIPHEQRWQHSRDFANFADWDKKVAAKNGALFMDLTMVITSAYKKIGAQKVDAFFADKGTHTTEEGARFNAACVVAGLKSLSGDPLEKYFSKKGKAVVPYMPGPSTIISIAAVQLASGGGLPLVTEAHAHNDYEHRHPLFDALNCGFCSVEADIFLVNGRLLVAHTLAETKPGRTLESLYLDPLHALVKKNNGHVYTNGPEFTLLIDLKQNWTTLYPPLRDILKQYSDMLVSYRTVTSNPSVEKTPAVTEVKQTNAVIVIITGNRDERMFSGETVRYASLDGQLSDLDENPPASLVPWISANWKEYFKWKGFGAMPDAELHKLRIIVDLAHKQGRRVRFWNSPDNPNFWQAIHSAGVDLINTDDLPGVAKFFSESN